MKRSEAEKILGELNEILGEKPLAKAVEDSRFETLQQRLKESGRRTIIDEFQIADGKAYGKARLVEKDSMEAMAIYGRSLNSGITSCSAGAQIDFPGAAKIQNGRWELENCPC